MNELTPIRKAVAIVGNQTKLAEILDVAPSAVQQWVAANHVPAKRVLAVEAATGGQVTRSELRPDIYPAEPRMAAA